MSRIVKPSCDNCMCCHPIKDCILIVDYMRGLVFYCDHFESLYCENSPCDTGYKERRSK